MIFLLFTDNLYFQHSENTEINGSYVLISIWLSVVSNKIDPQWKVLTRHRGIVWITQSPKKKREYIVLLRVMIYNWLSAAAGRGGLQRPRWDTQVFRCRCASFYPFISVPPFILVLSLFPLFFLSGPIPIMHCLASSLGHPWCIEGSNLIVGCLRLGFSKVVEVENDVEKNPHQYFANAHFASLQQVTWRHGSAKYLSRKCFGSNLFPSIKPLFGPSSNKGFAVSFKIFT